MGPFEEAGSLCSVGGTGSGGCDIEPSTLVSLVLSAHFLASPGFMDVVTPSLAIPASEVTQVTCQLAVKVPYGDFVCIFLQH